MSFYRGTRQLRTHVSRGVGFVPICKVSSNTPHLVDWTRVSLNLMVAFVQHPSKNRPRLTGPNSPITFKAKALKMSSNS